MKNITLSVDDKDLEAVRIYAAERQTTVNALVRDYLGQLARQRTQAQAAMARLRQLSEQSRSALGPDYKFDRDSLHER
jgi:hypothetical protein